MLILESKCVLAYHLSFSCSFATVRFEVAAAFRSVYYTKLLVLFITQNYTLLLDIYNRLGTPASRVPRRFAHTL